MTARLRGGLPFLYSLAMLQVYVSIDIIMLGHFRSARQVGIYAVANRLPSALIVLANVWINAFFPHAATQVASHPKTLLEQVGRIVTVMVVLAIGLTVGAALCAPGLITWLFGAGFSSAGAPCAVLATAAAVTLVDVTYGNVLLGCSWRAHLRPGRYLRRTCQRGCEPRVDSALGARGGDLYAHRRAPARCCAHHEPHPSCWPNDARLGSDPPRPRRRGRDGRCVLLARPLGAPIYAAVGVVTFFAVALRLGAIDSTLVLGPSG